jgi:hypothetical protein
MWPIMAFRPATIASSNQDIGSKPRVMFEASPITPNAANKKQAYWQASPNNAHLLTSALACSRFLKGSFSKRLPMMDIASFFLVYNSVIPNRIKDFRIPHGLWLEFYRTNQRF